MGTIVSILTVVVTLLICGAIAWLILSNIKNQVWEGTIASKNADQSDNGEYTTTSYVLTVDLQEGKQKKVRLSKKQWEGFNIGDKIIKEKGKFSPTKA